MNGLQGSRIVGGNTAYERVDADFYPTPPEATQALLNVLRLPEGTRVWEPAAGEGHMVRVLEDYGYNVKATDIKTGEDFLTGPLYDGDWIITNPPFNLAEAFIRRCAEYQCKPFAMLLKSQFWHAKKRASLFEEHPPALILPLTWRPDFLMGKRGGGSPLMDVMWCVWHDGWRAANNGITAFYPLRKPDMLSCFAGGGL